MKGKHEGGVDGQNIQHAFVDRKRVTSCSPRTWKAIWDA